MTIWVGCVKILAEGTICVKIEITKHIVPTGLKPQNHYCLVTGTIS